MATLVPGWLIRKVLQKEGRRLGVISLGGTKMFGVSHPYPATSGRDGPRLKASWCVYCLFPAPARHWTGHWNWQSLSLDEIPFLSPVCHLLSPLNTF